MRFLAALSFFTIIPTKSNKDEFNDGGRNYWWVVGLLIGLANGAFIVLTFKLFGALISAGLTLLFDGLLTQFIHYDGLADGADALLCSKSKTDRLKILKDPNVGVFGLCLVIMTVLIRFAILKEYLSFRSVNYLGFTLLIGPIYMLARSLVYLIGSQVRIIDSSFLGKSVFKAKISVGETIGQVIVCCAALIVAGYDFNRYFRYQYSSHVDSLLVYLYPVLLLSVMIAVIIGIYRLAAKRLGGINGDIMGSAILLSETAGLLVGVAKW